MKLEWESNATFRLSLVGALKGPHLFDIMVELIGKKETIIGIQKQLKE
jgi:glutamyl-tRNA synthetase